MFPFVYVLICSRRRGRTSNLRFRGAYFLIMLCGFRYYVPYIGWPSLAPPSSAFLSLVTCLDSMAQSIMPVSCLLLLADTSRLTAFLFSVADLTHHVPSRTRSNMLMCSVSERGGELASRRPRGRYINSSRMRSSILRFEKNHLPPALTPPSLSTLW